MKFELYTPNNRIKEDKYKLIYRIIIDNYFKRNPELLINKEEIDTEEAFNNWVNTILTTNDYYIMVIYKDNLLLGFVAFMYKDNKLCLSEIQIKEEYQNKGYLKEILREVINNTDKTRYSIVYGTINKKNIRSQNVFTHIGMVNTEKNKYEISLIDLEKWINKNT